MVKKAFTSFFLLLITLSGIGQTNWPYDFTKGTVHIQIDPVKEEVQGKVKYRFRVIKPIDSVYLDARSMELKEVGFNGSKANYEYDGRRIIIRRNLKPGKNYRLEIEYAAQPKQAVYFLGWKDSIVGNEQIWTQGQGKYTSHWLPSFDEMSEKVIFDLAVSYDQRYEVIANGKLRKTRVTKNQKQWKYQMVRPMSSYLLAFAIGDYTSTEIRSKSGVPISLYTYNNNQQKSEPTYRYSEALFNFLESEIGIPYPWQNYKQVPVRDFLYAGMENTSLTIFSDGYVVDSIAFKDLNYVNVNAHELAHQWFGNLVTETDAAQHWLHEGLATYYAYLAEREIFGADYVYWKLWDTAQQLKQQDKQGEGEALSDPAASSLTFYEKGAWAALMLSAEVGKDTYREGIAKFLREYAFKNATLSQFFEVMEASCDCSLSNFHKIWFESEVFPYQQCEEYLIKISTPIRFFNEIQRELTVSPDTNEKIIRKYWDQIKDPELKRRIILRYSNSLSDEFLKEVANQGHNKIRQAISLSMPRVTPDMQATFESFLNDSSYVTRENAFYKLWLSFPDKRTAYLHSTREISGLPNKSFRITWLLLAILARDYGDPASKAQWQTELRNYTAAHNSFEVRQNAFVVIHDVLDLNDQNLRDLAQACVHHVWQFRKFARNLMEELLRDRDTKVRIQAMMNQLGEQEQAYLKTVLEE